MSAYSTLEITRHTARSYIMSKILDVGDETLGDIMDILLRDRLYNCTIVSDYDTDNDDGVL